MNLHASHRHLLILLLAASLAIVTTGCGNEQAVETEYRDGLKQLQADFADANEASRKAAAATDAQERAAGLEQAHHALEQAANTAAEMEPPADVESAHRRLEQALGDYADLFAQLASLRPGDPRETELYSSAGEIVAKLDAANQALKRAGYDVSSDADDA